MAKRVVAGVTIGAAVVAVVGVAGAPAHAAPSWRVVHPGESIQAALDAARPGDTVMVLPGTYRGSVRITKDDVTLRGTSAGATVLTPAATAGGDTCAQAGDGVCVSGAAGVRVESLTVTGFAKYGVWATSADDLRVDHVHADANGQYGIGQEKSVRSAFTANEASGNGQAGLLVANTVAEEGGAVDTRGTEIRGNTLTANHMGLVVRRLRDVAVEGNRMSGNCAGVFLVGDENTPRAGEMTIDRNTVTSNNAYCAASDRLPYVQGAGIVLTGVENTVLSRNDVTGNVGASPLSGGIVLFPSFVGVPNSGDTVRDNTLRGNGPADLADRDHGTGNTFTANDCQVSLPAGHC
jgi:nitrous oxidase accessory protein NosD